jgi:transaldolase
VFLVKTRSGLLLRYRAIDQTLNLKPKKECSLNKLGDIPDTSELYYFYEENNLLYVGKALRLRQRIRDHKQENDISKEGEKHLKIVQSRADAGLDFNTLSNDVLDDISKCYGMFSGHQRIDLVLHRTTRIEIEEMPHELTESKEKEMIEKFQPPFNHETEVWDEIDDIVQKHKELALKCLIVWENRTYPIKK